MDAKQINSLTPERRQEYIEAERFYGSKGWKDHKEWLLEQKAMALHMAAFADTWEQNRVNLGVALFVDQVLSVEDNTFRMFEEEVEVALNEESSDAGNLFV